MALAGFSLLSYALQFLLFSNYWHRLFTQCAFAPLAHVQSFIAVVEFTHRKVQVTDTTAARVRLARYLTILLEKIVQRL